MICSDTGGMQSVHLPHLSLDVARDIDITIGQVLACSQSEGHIHLKILPGGVIPVIEMMIRKIRPQKKRPVC